MNSVVALPTRDELRNFIRAQLCERDRLDPQQSTFREAPMFRLGQICGLYFEVQGPRLLRSHAIWAAEEHRVIFYDSTSTRFATVQLTDAPDPATFIESNESRAA